MKLRLFLILLVSASLTRGATAREAFVPAQFEAAIEAAHEVGAEDHLLTITKITSMVENMNTGKVTVVSVTQLLDCKTGKLLSQSRCNPCEYNTAEFPRRPTDTYFVEYSWINGQNVARRKADMRREHFHRYFKLERLDGTDHQGSTYQYWRFDGRRGSPLVVHQAPKVELGVPVESPKPKYGPVERLEIFQGQTRRDEIIVPRLGDGRISLRAVAYAKLIDSDTLSQIDSFDPMWSASCGTLSSTKNKIIQFALKPNVDTCKVYLFDGRSGTRDSVVVKRPEKPKPSVRVVITFGKGKDADGVVLKGTRRKLELTVQAFNPDGSPLQDFRPEWSVTGGKVKFLDKTHKRRLRLHLDPGVTSAEVRARDPRSGAEDVFIIEVH